MKPARLSYVRAQSAEEAIHLIANHNGYAKFLAGGQTLGPMINLRLAQPDLVVDISRLTQLRKVTEGEDYLSIGAATLHADIEDGLVPNVANGLLRKVASGIAYRAVRNRGTIGGSLAHADPSAEWPAVMMALGARLIIRGAAGSRIIECSSFMKGAMTTVLSDDELIETVEIPHQTPTIRWGFEKKARKVGEYAHALAVVIRDSDRRKCSVVLGATGGAPIELKHTSMLLGSTRGTIIHGFDHEVQKAYEADVDEIGTFLDEYDRHVQGLAVIRASREALA